MKWKTYYGKRAIIFKFICKFTQFICKFTQFICIFTQIPKKFPQNFVLKITSFMNMKFNMN